MIYISLTIEEDTEDKNSDDTNSKNDANNPTASTSETVDVAIPQQKKKKKKKSANIDFHDSGPIEDDENRLYDPSKSLTHRVFNSYLRFGGISTGPKSFLGQDGLDNADADAEEIAARRVTDYIDYEADDMEVCPEYEEDMQMALQIAHKAKEELPNCKAFAQNAPGKLNKACSLLFGGELYGMLDDPWNGEEMVASMIGISRGRKTTH
ncbi:uncharacterized protein OCT59_014405 [Rhizophagus irregularis]|uniref:uncharacterized protein n=1 Tax=Rhizophagus irregularis TaxID=588596 RepID=UPI00332E18FA|nr:hypothetical protein OCT59_014405 [Rhizophagus irregularis]